MARRTRQPGAGSSGPPPLIGAVLSDWELDQVLTRYAPAQQSRVGKQNVDSKPEYEGAPPPDVVGPEPWRPSPWQATVLARREFEVFVGGARGPGKSAVGRVWLLMGNPEIPVIDSHGREHPVHRSYIHHPDYRALVLRRNLNDMGDWIAKAKKLYEPLGGWYSTALYHHFTFPSGAEIVVGHLDEADAWEKYQGHEYQRILIEELSQIPEERLYLMLFGSCRSLYPDLHPQIMCSANPIGKGAGWVRDRFVKIKRLDGTYCPAREPYADPETGLTRIFIPGGVKDNPFLAKADPLYIARLKLLPPAERRAMLDGDWEGMMGSYFSWFRPAGPLPGEPSCANHVIAPIPLLPWWHRWLSMDWGYQHEAAIYWYCHNPSTGQIYIYRELVVSQTSAVDIGYRIAELSMPDLLGLEGRHLSMHLSPDAYAKRNEDRSIAELIVSGLARILGPTSTALLEHDDERDPLQYLPDRRGLSVTVRRAQDQRVIGWQLLHETMRFDDPTRDVQYDPTIAHQILSTYGAAKYEEYLSFFRQWQGRVLPVLQIFNTCPRLIDAIPRAVHDDKNVEDVDKQHFTGMDSDDSVRYGISAFRHESTIEPVETRRQRLVAEARQANPSLTTPDLIWLNRRIEEQERLDEGGSFTVPRSVTRMGRLRLGGLDPSRGPGPGIVDTSFDFSQTPYAKMPTRNQ